MYGLTRGTTTLLAAGIAGGLIWLASWIGADSNGEYWTSVGVLAGAGLVMALSQLLGGWTKWGRPTVSWAVFGLAFVPTLIAAGWVLVAAQPADNGPREATRDWLQSIGLYDNFLDVLIGMAPVIAFGLGLVFGLIFDTTGPRDRDDLVYEDRYASEQPLAAEREHTETVPARERVHAHDGREHTAVAAGHADDRERVTPEAPQPAPERRRRGLFHR